MVSVIVPAYNAEKTLGECLSAIRKQVRSGIPVQVIVADDGSSDGTAEVATRFPGVILVRQSNHGPAAARNAGARKASGDILLFTDADCVPEENWISEMMGPFANPRVAAVKGAYRTHQSGLVARLVQVEFEDRYALLGRQPYVDFVDSHSAAFRARDFWAVGGFDPAFPHPNNEDVDLSYRLSRSGCRMVFNPRAVVSHGHPESLGEYARTKFWRGYWRTLVYRRFPDKALVDSYTPQLLKAQILLLLVGFAGLGLTPFVRGSGLVTTGVFLVFLAMTVPFARRASQTGWTLGVAAVLFLAVRAAALGLGVGWALVSGGAWRFPTGPTKAV